MHNMTRAERKVFDQKVREVCEDQTLQLKDVAARIGCNTSAISRSLRRSKLNRPLGNRKGWRLGDDDLWHPPVTTPEVS